VRDEYRVNRMATKITLGLLLTDDQDRSSDLVASWWRVNVLGSGWCYVSSNVIR